MASMVKFNQPVFRRKSKTQKIGQASNALELGGRTHNMKYLIYLTLSICVCTFFMGLLYFAGKPILFVPTLLSFFFGILFVPLVVIRLPLFKKYYINDINSLEIKITTTAERKSTVVAVSLVTAFSLALILYFLNLEQFGYYCFCGGAAAGFISEYYAPA